jgi:hypothetical protein
MPLSRRRMALPAVADRFAGARPSREPGARRLRASLERSALSARGRPEPRGIRR